MHVNAANQVEEQTGTAVMQVLGWLAAVVPAVVGLATIEVPDVGRAPQVVQTNVTGAREARASTGAAETTSALAGDEVDPGLGTRTAATVIAVDEDGNKTR